MFRIITTMRPIYGSLRILSAKQISLAQKSLSESDHEEILTSSFKNKEQNTNSTNSATQTDNSKNQLQISDSCIEQMKKIQIDEPDCNLRIVVEGGGCSGFQYKFELDSTINSDDIIFEKENIKVIVDEDSFSFVQGSMIEYHREMIRSTFRISNNPVADSGCSCGASFNIKL